MEAMANQTIQYLKKEKLSVPEHVWARAKAELPYNEYLATLSPVYKKYYSEAELDELIQFFSTPIGRKYISTGVLVGNESYAAGKTIGTQMVGHINQALSEKGY